MNGAQSMSIKELSIAWNWVLRLRDDAVSQDDLGEWLAWYEADHRHRQAFEEMQAFWRGADHVLEGPGAPTMAQLLGARSLPAHRKLSPNTLFSLRVRFAAAATVLATIVGWAFWWTS